MQTGYIYALRNKSFGDNVIKIGKTKREPYIRAKDLYCGVTGVPEPFDVAFACQVSDYEMVERKIHERLKAYRINNKREFFRIPIKVAKIAILNVCQEVDKLFGCSVQNPIVIDISARDDLDLSPEDSYDDNSSQIDEIDPEKLVPSAAWTSLLSNEQKTRIVVIAEIFIDVFTCPLEKWIIDFSRDADPEVEICIWENIAKAFLKIDQAKYFSKEQKMEAFSLLLMRSMAPESKVLKKWKLKTFSKSEAKEILRGYKANPKPILVSFPPN